MSTYHLGMVDSRMKLLIWLYPLSIEVYASQVAASVSVYHAIRVEHGHDLEDEVVSQEPCSQTRAD